MRELSSRIEALEERLHRPHMPPEMVRSRIRELCVELGYTLPPEDDPDYPAACERLLEQLRTDQRERRKFDKSTPAFR